MICLHGDTGSCQVGNQYITTHAEKLNKGGAFPEISYYWKQLPFLDMNNRIVKDPLAVFGGNHCSAGAANEDLCYRKHVGLIGPDIGYRL